MNENWKAVYRDRVDIYEEFSRYEDASGRIWAKFLELTQLADRTVLDLGCGSGKFASNLAVAARQYLGLDGSLQMLGLAREKVRNLSNASLVLGEFESLPLSTQSVDIVFSSWAIGGFYPPDAERTSAEIARVLRPAGDIWLIVNHWLGEFMEMRGELVSEFERRDKLVLTERGFTVAAEVATQFEFPSLEDARRVFGFIFGDRARAYLKSRRSTQLEHRALILHKRVEDSVRAGQ